MAFERAKRINISAQLLGDEIKTSKVSAFADGKNSRATQISINIEFATVLFV